MQANLKIQQTVVLEPPLYFSQQNVHIWNTIFHPKQNILACSLINGIVEICKYDSDDVVRLLKIDSIHKGSVRWVTFNPEGTLLASCSEDKRIGFIDTEGKVAHIIKKAHESPINRCEFVDEHIFMSGDDDGQVKLWDLRTTQSIFQAKDQSDAITGLKFDQQHTNIISTSLDGTLAIYDVKKGTQSQDKLFAISDSIDEQLNGLQLMKDGKYIVCPSSQSSIVIFKRQCIDNYCDRLQGFPGAVQTILKINDNTLLAGCQDGFVRGVGIKPSKIVQTIGQHEEDENFPIQSLSLSFCGNIVASTSHDNSIKFYDVSQFSKKRAMAKLQAIEENQESQAMHLDSSSKQKMGKVKKQQEMVDSDGDIMQDADSDQNDSDDSDDSDEMQEQGATKSKKKKKVNSKHSIQTRQKQLKKIKQKSFFKGL